MKTTKFIAVIGVSLLLLAGCGDSKPPTAVIKNLELQRNFVLTEDTLIEKMVTDVDDNRKMTSSQPVDITNYSDIDFSKLGIYELDIVITDDAGNRGEFTGQLTIKPSDKEQEEIEFQSKLEEYKQQITDFAAMKLADPKEVAQLEKSVKHLTKENYVDFQTRLDEFSTKLLNQYIAANDVLLMENTELVNRALAIDSEDTIVLAYQEELADFNVAEQDLQTQNKMYSRGLKIKDGLSTKIKAMEIEHSSIPEELYGNILAEISTCNYNVGRNASVKVDIGNGNRNYLSYTNKHDQLVFITADQISVQDESKEQVNDNGEYCDQVPNIDGGKGYKPSLVIADSLGGASNSYNVIPAGNADQQLEAIENEILAYGSATEYRAYFTYPDDESIVPSSIEISYKLGENLREYKFNN